MTANTVHHIVFVDLDREVQSRDAELPSGVGDDGAALEYLGGVGFPHPAILGAVSFVGFTPVRPLTRPEGEEGTFGL